MTPSVAPSLRVAAFRSGAESLVGFIEQYANLRFKLALVEAAAYSLPDASFLLQPRLLVKTVVLENDRTSPIVVSDTCSKLVAFLKTCAYYPCRRMD